MHPTSFLINGKIAIDAGAITAALSLQEQAEIGHIFFSHSHVDHLATLPFLLDNIFSAIRTPVVLYGPDHTIRCLREHFFNNQLWPDFTAFSNERSSIVTMQSLGEGETIEIDGVRLTSAPMDHAVQCFGYLVEQDGGAIFVCGDTCSLDGAMPLLKRTKGLDTMILEASFPNRLEKIARLSQHLTPSGFAREVAKAPEGIRVLVTHMKPECLGEIQQEIADLSLPHITLIEQGATYIIKPADAQMGNRP